jgi:hypothetical protein
MNFGTLKATVALELMRTDLTAQIPGFVAKAEGAFNRRLRTAAMVAQETLAFVDNVAELPDDFLDGKVILFSGSPALFVPVDKMGPRSVTIVGRTLWKGDLLPDAAELYYFQQIPALTEDADTNWLLTAYPDLYVEMTKFHGFDYLMDEARSDRALQHALGIIEEINLQGQREQFTGAPLRIRARAI